jgi:hypothetical protein
MPTPRGEEDTASRDTSPQHRNLAYVQVGFSALVQNYRPSAIFLLFEYASFCEYDRLIDIKVEEFCRFSSFSTVCKKVLGSLTFLE